MDAVGVIFIIGSLIGITILAWTYTKPGKKWLKEL